MLYGVFKLYGDTYHGFYDYPEWFSATFCPDTEVITTIDLTVHGETYSARKSDVEGKALDYQSLFGEFGISLSYGEIAEWERYFQKQGGRYGLLKTFRENGIC